MKKGGRNHVDITGLKISDYFICKTNFRIYRHNTTKTIIQEVNSNKIYLPLDRNMIKLPNHTIQIE